MPRRSALAHLGGIVGGMFLAALPMRGASCTTNRDCARGQCCNPNNKTCIPSTQGTSCGNGSNAVCCTAGTTCCAGGNVALCCTSDQLCSQGPGKGENTTCQPKKPAPCTTNRDCSKNQCCNPNTKTCIPSTQGTSCGNGSNAVCCTAGTTCCAGENVSLCCTSGQCCSGGQEGEHQGEHVTCGTKCGKKCCCGGSTCCNQHTLTCVASGGCSTCGGDSDKHRRGTP
jgi:hypothetical protein